MIAARQGVPSLPARVCLHRNTVGGRWLAVSDSFGEGNVWGLVSDSNLVVETTNMICLIKRVGSVNCVISNGELTLCKDHANC